MTFVYLGTIGSCYQETSNGFPSVYDGIIMATSATNVTLTGLVTDVHSLPMGVGLLTFIISYCCICAVGPQRAHYGNKIDSDSDS